MASPRRSTTRSVTQQLLDEPHRFSFAQAVRLLELTASAQHAPRRRVGSDALPEQECVHFAALAARSFPPTEVAGLTGSVASDRDSDKRPPKLTVAFMGLFGPSGVLPYHDTQRIIDAGAKKNPERDFLDVFNHRILSLFFRASVKYRIPTSYETTYRDPRAADDVFARALYALVGMGTDGLRQRIQPRDELMIEFAGFFGHQPKNAESLRRILESYFDLKVSVVQFVGQWMSLSEENKSLMPTPQMRLGQNCALGKSFILGERVWDITGKFRLRVGPVGRQQFESLLPGSPDLIEFAQIARLYAGTQFDFDIQLELLAQDVPGTQLGGSSRLGLNTWLFSRQPEENKSDAVFVQSGLPLPSRLESAA